MLEKGQKPVVYWGYHTSPLWVESWDQAIERLDSPNAPAKGS
jgi:hypothetical protein